MLELPFFTKEAIDVASLEQQVRTTESGAVVTYQGVVRADRSASARLSHLIFEADESGAHEAMADILKQIGALYPGTTAAIQHRLGRVSIGETSVFIAVSSPSKAHAFEACRFAMDRLKTAVPLWKADVFSDGTSGRSVCSHETMLLADEAIAIPES